jgi:hypothetical protein
MTVLDAAPQTRTDDLVLGGRFRLDRPSGQVGRAQLWRAVDVVLRRPVTVHMLPEWTPVPGLAAAVQAAAGVSDARLATVYDACYDPERPYLVSEWAADPTLERLLPAGLPSPGLAAHIMAEAAQAVAAAHDQARPHLRLDLGRLHWGRSGLKITGLGIDAVLYGAASPDPVAADTIALARILYTLLTGYWPGDRAAAGTPWEPRELRPAVPLQLNAIVCHALPAWGTPSISNPVQLAAALRVAANED